MDPDLANAITWRDAQAPTVAWAKRYGGDDPDGEFELAMRFLRESAAAAEQQRQAEEARTRERQEQIERERELARDARAARMLRRLALGLASVCLTTLVVAAWAFIQKRTADTQTHLANARGLAAVGAARLDVEPNLAAAFALRALESGTGEGEVLLRQALFRMPNRVFRGSGPVAELAFSSDGLRLAVAYEGGAVEVRDVTTGEVREVRKVASERITAMTFVNGSRRLAVAIDRDEKGSVVLVDVTGPGGEAELPTPVGGQGCKAGSRENPPLHLALHPGGAWLASSWEDGNIVVWDLTAQGNIPASVLVGSDCEPFNTLRFTQDGAELVAATRDRLVVRWNTGGWSQPARSITIPPQSPTIANLGAFDIDAAKERGVVRLRSSGVPQKDYNVSVIGLKDGRLLRTIVQGTGESTGPVFSPDGSQIVAADAEGAIHVWDASSGERQRTLRGHMGTVSRLSVWSPAEGEAGRAATIVSGGEDGTVRLWSLTPLSVRVLEGHKSQSTSVAFTPDGRRLVSGGVDRTVRLWDADRGREIRQIGKHGNDVYAVAVSPNGELAASAGGTAMGSSPTSAGDRTIRIWDLAKEGPPLRMIAPPADVVAMAFSADGAVLATAGAEPAVRLWDVTSGRLIAEMRWAGETGSMGLSFSQDGRFIVAAGAGAARVFDRAAGKEIRVLAVDNPDAHLSAALFGDNGRIVLTTSVWDPVITIWDAIRGAKLRQFRGYASSNGAALSADGSLAVTADMGEIARLWDVRTGTLLTGLTGAEGAWSAVFSSTPTRLATTSSSGKIFVWDCEPCGALPDLVRLARERLKNALTEEQLRAVALQ